MGKVTRRKTAPRSTEGKTKAQPKAKFKARADSTLAPSCFPDTVPVHLLQNFTYCFHKAALRLRALLDSRLQPFGVIAPQLGLLRVLHEQGPQSQVGLGLQLGIDKATMVKLIDSLENLRLVRRTADRGDRRVKFIALTRQGEDLFQKGIRIRQTVEKEFLSILSEEERKVILQAVPKLLQLTVSESQK